MMNKLPPGVDMDMLMKLLEQYGKGQPPMQNKGPAPYSPGSGMSDVISAASGAAGMGGQDSFVEAAMGKPGFGSPADMGSTMKIPKSSGPTRVSPGMYKGADGKVFKSKTQPR